MVTLPEFEGAALLDAREQAELSAAYAEHGAVVLRRLVDPATVVGLRMTCERVYEQWRALPLTDNPPVGDQSNYMRHVNHYEYFRGGEQQQAECWQLLDCAAHPRVLAAAGAALDEEFVFAQISLYFNPTGPSEDGFW